VRAIEQFSSLRPFQRIHSSSNARLSPSARTIWRARDAVIGISCGQPRWSRKQ
jgi:hypothetical protein